MPGCPRWRGKCPEGQRGALRGANPLSIDGKGLEPARTQSGGEGVPRTRGIPEGQSNSGILRFKRPTMIPLIAEHTEQIAEICRQHHVKRLDVFGSAAVGDFKPDQSDIDFIVEFGRRTPETLVRESHRPQRRPPIPLQPRSRSRRRHRDQKPYFRKSVDETREQIYAA